MSVETVEHICGLCPAWQLSAGLIINEKLTGRNQFSAADVNRHLEFDAIKPLRNLVGRGYLEAVGGGVFQRAAWPPPAALLEGEPIGLTYCIQRWFKYYLQQWITDAMRELETREGVYSLDSRGERPRSFRMPSAPQDNGYLLDVVGATSCRTGAALRNALGHGAESLEIAGRFLAHSVKLPQQFLHIVKFHAQHAAP